MHHFNTWSNHRRDALVSTTAYVHAATWVILAVKKWAPSLIPDLEDVWLLCTSFVQLIPVGFVNEHADKIQLRCTLQAEASGEVWSVNLWASAAQNEVKISRGWKAFASSNELKIGDQLLFSLTAMSKFVVYIFDFAGFVKEPRRAPLTSCYRICNCNCQDCKAWHDLWKSKNLSRTEQYEEASAPSLSLSNKETVSGYAMHPATTNSSKRCTNGDKVLLEGASQLVSKETPAVKPEINIAQSQLSNRLSRPKRTTGDQTGTEIGNFAGSFKKTSSECFFRNFGQVPPVASLVSSQTILRVLGQFVKRRT